MNYTQTVDINSDGFSHWVHFALPSLFTPPRTKRTAKELSKHSYSSNICWCFLNFYLHHVGGLWSVCVFFSFPFKAAIFFFVETPCLTETFQWLAVVISLRKQIVQSPFFAYTVTSIITFNLVVLGHLVNRVRFSRFGFRIRLGKTTWFTWNMAGGTKITDTWCNQHGENHGTSPFLVGDTFSSGCCSIVR